MIQWVRALGNQAYRGLCLGSQHPHGNWEWLYGPVTSAQGLEKGNFLEFADQPA